MNIESLSKLAGDYHRARQRYFDSIAITMDIQWDDPAVTQELKESIEAIRIHYIQKISDLGRTINEVTEKPIYEDIPFIEFDNNDIPSRVNGIDLKEN